MPGRSYPSRGPTPSAASTEAPPTRESSLCQELVGLPVPNKPIGHRLQESGLFSLLCRVQEEEPPLKGNI